MDVSRGITVHATGTAPSASMIHSVANEVRHLLFIPLSLFLCLSSSLFIYRFIYCGRIYSLFLFFLLLSCIFFHRIGWIVILHRPRENHFIPQY